VILVVVSFFAQLLPRGLGLLRGSLRVLQLFSHFRNLRLHLRVFVRDVGYQANSIVLKDTLLLQLVPLLLKDVHGLLHLHASQEVSDEIVDHHRPFHHLWLRLSSKRAIRGPVET